MSSTAVVTLLVGLIAGVALGYAINRFLIKAKQDGSCDRILRRWVPGLK